MVAHAKAMAARGLETFTFDFGKRTPAELEKRWIDVVTGLPPSSLPLVMAGKSMGGRIASMVVARGALAPRALVFFGYPLHPPGQPEKRRDAHLPQIGVPMLFVQGTRDEFGTREEIEPLVRTLPTARLHAIEGARHQFPLDDAIVDAVAAFIRAIVE
jgi:predicted alpha/beta-hydrolase family hydrolase